MAKILEFKKPEEHKDDMLPVEQWDGSAWEAIFQQVFVPYSKELNCSPWDCLANFVRGLLIGEDEGSNR